MLYNINTRKQNCSWFACVLVLSFCARSYFCTNSWMVSVSKFTHTVVFHFVKLFPLCTNDGKTSVLWIGSFDTSAGNYWAYIQIFCMASVEWNSGHIFITLCSSSWSRRQYAFDDGSSTCRKSSMKNCSLARICHSRMRVTHSIRKVVFILSMCSIFH